MVVYYDVKTLASVLAKKKELLASDYDALSIVPFRCQFLAIILFAWKRKTDPWWTIHDV